MDIKIKTNETIGHLLALEKKQVLKVDHEYQRGLAWSKYQQQFFIDSIFRNYPVPAFYLHKETVKIDEDSGSITLWIVDGQQRINAIGDFVKGVFPLLNPDNRDDFRFPNFIKDEKVSWAGKRFEDLTEQDKKDFLSTEVVTYTITTDNKNRIRDLFIRLQGGVALTPQDRRDSWPGEFTKFILVVGGKSGKKEWYGWDFFREIPKMSSESKRRTLVAQCYMLFQKNRDKEKLADINLSSIDDYYHANVGFDNEPNHKVRFKTICDLLYDLFKDHPRISSGHYVIHLILFMDSILDKAIPSCFARIPDALQTFKERVQEAKTAFKNNDHDFEHSDYFYYYGHYTSSSSDTSSSIQRRHAFFVKEMEELAKIDYKDQKRTLSDAGRASVYYRDNRKCQVCRMDGNDEVVRFSEAEFHHIKPHAEGGKTNLDNLVTVHERCHPKAPDEVTRFRAWWNENKFKRGGEDINKSRTTKSKKLPPDGTKLRHVDRKNSCEGKIVEGKIHITINGSNQIFNAFSTAAKAAVGKTQGVNGWVAWEVKTPDSDEWLRADRWRDSSNP